MKREELIEFLKEVLHVCGESVVMEMVWLEKAVETSGIAEEKYHLVIRSNSDLSDDDCLGRIIEKFGLKLEKKAGLWVLSDNKAKIE